MKNYIYLIAIVTVIGLSFSSCKDPVNPNNSEVYPNYFPLKVGNYWIYSYYSVDSLGKETDDKIIDSLFISKDTLINNNKFFVFEIHPISLYKYPRLLRDSSGYIITEKGKKLFSSSNFKDSISKDEFWRPSMIDNNLRLMARVNWKMDSGLRIISVPAGNFNVLTNHGYITAYYYDKADSIISSVNSNQFEYYAENIGKIKMVFHFYTNIKYKRTTELRLVRYKIY